MLLKNVEILYKAASLFDEGPNRPLPHVDKLGLNPNSAKQSTGDFGHIMPFHTL